MTGRDSLLGVVRVIAGMAAGLECCSFDILLV
jgi:hypothetical protein